MVSSYLYASGDRIWYQLVIFDMLPVFPLGVLMSSDVTPQISDKRRSFSATFKMNIAQLAAPQLLPVKIQGNLYPVSEVELPVQSSVAESSSLTLSFRSGTQLCIQQLTPDLLRTVLESLR